MTYINHLNHFLYISKKDNRLSCSHFSMYIALFYIWNNHKFVNPFNISRDETMALSHIGSKTTYLKVLDELHSFGYIRHEKPKSKYWKSRITMVKLGQKGDESQLSLFESEGPKKGAPRVTLNPEPVPELIPHIQKISVRQSSQNSDAGRPKMLLNSVPKLGPIIHRYFIEGVESVRHSAHPPIFPLKNNDVENSREEVAAGGQNCDASNVEKLLPVTSLSTSEQATKPDNALPSFSQVQEFFLSLKPGGSLEILPAKWTAKEKGQEAIKFFSHYAAIGWKMGGVHPIVNWKAAARKWILNCWQHSPRPVPINSSPPANYQAPPNDPNTADYSTPL